MRDRVAENQLYQQLDRKPEDDYQWEKTMIINLTEHFKMQHMIHLESKAHTKNTRMEDKYESI